MKKLSLMLIALSITVCLFAEKREKTDANIFGHVVSGSEHIPFASVFLKGTTIGVSTDQTGHYRLLNLPEGEFIIVAKVVGFKPEEKKITIKKGKTIEVNFNLTEDILGLEEVVVTGDRNEMNRKESPVIVNAIPAKLLTQTQSITICEGLNFCPGLRVENNCQNCGFTQLRMNGMEGPYSQILINSRPIFSGLAGVYGLEFIPDNMVERIEVVRGGGSAIYGSNAIAGTVNVILKDPIANSYEFGYDVASVGTNSPALDQGYKANVSLVSDDHKSGITLYAFHRKKQGYDDNGDGFTELGRINNTTFGSRFFHSVDVKSKINADIYIIKEERRGGDNLDRPEHESQIAESLKHTVRSGSISYDRFLKSKNMFSVFFSAQEVDRDSYYGAGGLENYGHTNSFTYVSGATYKAQFDKSNFVIGLEHKGEKLEDNNLGFTDELGEYQPTTIIADQKMNISGGYTQYDYRLNAFKFALGIRYDHYNIKNGATEDSTKGDVLSPRVNILFDATEHLQFRASYSKGYRAPQVFDEDLHITSSESRRITIVNDADLEQETSHSFLGSIDFHPVTSIGDIEFLAEYFYTKLDNPFATHYGDPDTQGNVIYTRYNETSGATVQGVNTEITYIPSKKFNMIASFTFQSSKYNEPQDFNSKEFFRSPESYGYINMLWTPNKKWEVSLTGNYTGKMKVPYFGTEAAIDPVTGDAIGELRESDEFFELGFKLSRSIKLNGTSLKLYAGVKNLFNSYQDDFDIGAKRDPAYIYGPGSPRTIYFGLKLGNMFK